MASQSVHGSHCPFCLRLRLAPSAAPDCTAPEEHVADLLATEGANQRTQRAVDEEQDDEPDLDGVFCPTSHAEDTKGDRAMKVVIERPGSWPWPPQLPRGEAHIPQCRRTASLLLVSGINLFLFYIRYDYNLGTIRSLYTRDASGESLIHTSDGRGIRGFLRRYRAHAYDQEKADGNRGRERGPHGGRTVLRSCCLIGLPAETNSLHIACTPKFATEPAWKEASEEERRAWIAERRDEIQSAQDGLR
jgi:hypothetical protein